MTSQSWNDADVNAAGSRPGFYINFQQAAAAAVVPGARGTVGIISEADWGPPNEIVEIAALSEAESYFTDEEDATARLYNLVRFAFRGGANVVKAARVLNTTNAVKGTLTLTDTNGTPVNTLRIDAKYVGTYGNNISVEVADDPVDATKTRIRIFVEDALVHAVTSTVNTGAAGFTDNIVALFTALDSPWIDVVKLADGDNDLDPVAETNLASGANGDAVTATQFNTVLDLFAANRVNILTTDSAVGAIQTAIAEWIADQRAANYYVIGVLGADLADSVVTMNGDANAFNTAGIVYVGPGVVMPNVAGTSATYSGASVASVVAGLIAGVPSGRAITFMGIPGSTNVEQLFTNAEIKSLLANGVCAIAVSPPGSVPTARVERGITTLYNPGVDDISSYKKIRTIRIADAIAEGLSDAANSNFIGRQLDNDAGRAAIIGAVRDFLRTQADAQLIEDDYTVELDEEESTGDGNLFLNIAIKPIDAVEFIWSTISLG